MKQRATQLTLSAAGRGKFTVGDVLYVPSSGEKLLVTSVSCSRLDELARPKSLRETVVDFIRGRGWSQVRMTWNLAPPLIRVWKMRPSPLPRRLP